MNVTPPSGPAVSGGARTVGSFYPFGVAGRGMWVRSEYAGELSVLSAWLCALLPWAVSTRTLGESRLFRPHFHYAFLQFVPGADLGRALDPFVAVYDGPGFPANPTTAVGYQWWLVGAVVFTLVLAWSVLYYVYDEQLEARSPADPVRVMGGLLVAAAVPLTVSAYYVGTGFSGLTVPVGVVFMYLFGGLLLVVERA